MLGPLRHLGGDRAATNVYPLGSLVTGLSLAIYEYNRLQGVPSVISR